MTAPKVSVIIPSLNGEKYLVQCMEAVVGQTLHEIEIICIDDGSTDATGEIMESYAARDSRVSVVHEENLGLGAARNRGMELACGEYLSFLDGDDFFEPEMLEKAYLRAKAVDADVVIYETDRYLDAESRFSPHVIHQDLSKIPSKDVFSAAEIAYNVFDACVGWVWDKLYRREYIVSNELRFQEIRSHEDTSFCWMAILLAGRLSLVNEVLLHYRVHPSQMSHKEELHWMMMCEALGDLRRQMEERGLFACYTREFANFCAKVLVDPYQSCRPSRLRCRMHEQLHGRWLAELGLAQLGRDQFDSKKRYSTVVSIMSTSTDDFLLAEYEAISGKLAGAQTRQRRLNEECRQADAAAGRYAQEAARLHASAEWRAGRAATAPLRGLKKLARNRGQ